MTKASYWQRGETLDYVNETEEMIEAGAVIAFGNRVGVAGTDIMPGETGSIHVEGVFEFPKDEGAVTAGEDVYFDVAAMLFKMQGLAVASANGTYNSTVKTTIRAGYAVQNAEADAETVLVKINA